MVAHQAHTGDFIHVQQMTDITAGIILANPAIAIFIQRPQVFSEFAVTDIKFAFICKSAPMPAIAGRDRTIKHVYAQTHCP